MDCEMQLVLNRGKESLSGIRLDIIIHCGSINVGDLLIEATFTGTDLPNLRQQIVVVFLA